MSTHDQNIANDTGAAVRADINNALAAIFSNSSNATAPSTTVAYQWWADTTSGLLKQRNAANSGWLLRGTLAETFVISRSSNTILGLADFRRTFVCTSTFTQTLTAAATLGDGWFCNYRNDGSGVITLDPNASETIDGAATIDLQPGEGCVIVCNGAQFNTIGRTPTGWSTSDVKLTLKTTADAGWVMMDDKTLGDASSGATGRANADTVALFTLLWNNTADADCAVSSGRGANAAADFAAHKTIALPKTLGRALAGAGAGSGLTSRALGSKVGAETMPAHDHTFTRPTATSSTVGQGTGTITNAGIGYDTLNTGSTGTGTHGVMQPTWFMNVMIKL